MSEPPTDVGSFTDQFAYDLAAVYDMELKLADALTDLSGSTTNDNLGKGFALHATETERQVRRVEAAFAALGREPARREDLVVDGLLADTDRFEAVVTDDRVANARYLTAAIATEHHEITRYEGLLRAAERAGLADGVTAPLEDNLAEEEKTLRKLRGLAGDGSLRGAIENLVRS